MVIEGDSSSTTPDMTLSCNLSSVDLEGDSSHVRLDDYIEWNPSRVIRRVFSLDVLVTIGVLGTGVPRLACLRPAAWLKGGPSMAHLHEHKPKTLARGQSSRGGRRGASSGTASSG